jgi:hypothetical protein
MANEEAFTLDGLALNSGALAVAQANLNPPPPRYQWASSVDTEGAVLVSDPLYENREVVLTIQVQPQTTTDLALAQVAAVRDKLAKASATNGGIDLVWVPAEATVTCTFDVLAGEFTDLPIDWENGWLAKAPSMTLRLICAPYWHKSEVLTSAAGSGTAPFATLEIPTVPGDIDATARLIVTDTASQARRHVEWGWEDSATYNSATSLIIDSDDMVTSGFAGAQATTTGAYDPNAAGTNSVTVTPIPGGTTAMCGVGNLSHIGTFRLKARVQSGSLSNLVRFAWKMSDGPMTRNSWASPLSTAGWQEVDLGLIQIRRVTSGTQQWTGQIEVLGAASPGTVIVDYVIMVPVDAGYGVARGVYSYASGVVVGYDQFTSTTAGGVLNTRVAPSGGTWATSGDATDFVFADEFAADTTAESIKRATTAAETTGRNAILGSTNYTDTEVSSRIRDYTLTSDAESALIARWTDASNHLRFIVPTAAGSGSVRIEQIVAGSVTVLATSAWARAAQTTYLLRLIVYASGRVIGMVLNEAGLTLATMEASSTALATGGTLATGKPGLNDRSRNATAQGTRYFDDFTVSTPAAEPVVVNSGRSLEFRADEVVRQDSSSVYYGHPKSYEGTYVRVPVGTSRVLVKARRNDIEVALDDQILDTTTIQVEYSPRGLVVPR